MACEYCKNGEDINSYSVNRTYIEGEELYMEWMNGHEECIDHALICFCPMCGERLGDE